MCPPPIRYASWTIERNRGDARLIEPARAALCEQILVSAPIPRRDFEPVSASFAFAGPHGAERAIEIGAKTYGSLKSLLDNKFDRRPAPKRGTDGTPISAARAINICAPRSAFCSTMAPAPNICR
jgi:hypothetical protein